MPYFNTVANPTANPNKENPNDYKRSETSDFVDVEKFANHVYRNRMGNQASGQGYKFRGRGIFQLTGKYNYQQFTNFYKANYDATKDFIVNPSLLASDKELAVISALWFYKKNVLDKITGDIDIEKVTELINGGDNGLPHRKKLYNTIKEKNIDCL